MAQTAFDAMLAEAPAEKATASAMPEERAFWVFLALVALGGPVAAIGLASARWQDLAGLDLRRVLVAVFLTAVAAWASRFRLALSQHVHVNVSTAASVAMLILLPLPLPGLLAPLGKAAAELSRRREERPDRLEFAFNVGQTAWCVVAGALAFAVTRRLLAGGPTWLDDVALLAATAAGFLALHFVNSGLVAGIAGLHLHNDPWRLWVLRFCENLTAHATMAIVALAAALLVAEHPLALAALVLPLALVHRAFGASAQLRADTHAALETLVEVVELRDPYTAGHSRRVAELARVLALRLGQTPDEADHLASAGRVHDIGKIAIDPRVLTKPGKLDPAEGAEMRRHAELGADVIRRFAAYGDGHRLVRHHHEAWDGSGYPHGLAGEAIPLGARILAVADTFDALTTDRPYRPRLALDRAIAILADGAGKQWDPRVVAALVEHLAAARASAPRPVEPAVDAGAAAA